MALSKKLMAGGLAAFTLIATAGAALAAPAYVSSNVNVRSGPGTHYSVVDTIRRGQRVDVEQCRGNWCYVQKRGPDGWVSANYLERGGRPGWNDDRWDRPPVYRPYPPRRPRWDNWPSRPHYPNYPHRGGSSVCIDGPNGYFCVGD
jgi:SH3-like domain-containing protein